MFLSRVSFEDMVAQANAQGNVYTAGEESNDNLDQYSYKYGEYEGQESGVPPMGAGSALGLAAHVSAGGCSTRQACGVSGGNTRMAGKLDQPQQPALGSGDSGAGNSRAGKAGDAGAAGLGDRYTTGRNQLHCSIGHRQHSYTIEQDQQPCSIDQSQNSYATSSWEKLSTEEKLRKKKVWEHRKKHPATL